jgi:hypothetical protein
MLPLERWPEAARTLARTYGMRGGLLRAAHETRRAVAAFRLAPRHPLSARGPADAAFRVDAERLTRDTNVAEARARGDRVVGGSHQAYRWDWRPLPHTADEWLVHPTTGHRYAADAPWWKVPHWSASAGDIKDVWEPARFGWMYDLVRAALVTGDAKYADAARRHVESFRASSPPFRGPHWSCGQETAIRAVALLYAEANLPALDDLVPMLGASGERIADAIGYAVSQRNNHGISEAAGLVALGARLRAVHPEAPRWLADGTRLLERLVAEQFAEDGWYVQHSFTYMRVALDQCAVAERALRSVGSGLAREARERLARAAELLLAVIDAESGLVPNHGANDGAFVHPITLAAYRDFRPVVTVACALWGAALPSDVRACGESLAWMGLDAPTIRPPLPDGVTSGSSGWASARVGRGVVFVRAGRYASRPGHIDSLQVDVRAGARELVVDAGTYVYNAPPPWRNALAGATTHNGPLLDGREPGVRGPRFLWYVWPAADLVDARWDGRQATIVATRPDGVRRTVRASAHEVTIDDEVPAGLARSVAVRWLLHPDAPADALSVEGPHAVRAAEEDSPAGWFSPLYGQRLASRHVDVVRDAADGASLRASVRWSVRP